MKRMTEKEFIEFIESWVVGGTVGYCTYLILTYFGVPQLVSLFFFWASGTLIGILYMNWREKM